MTNQFMVTLVSHDGQCYGHVSENSTLVGVNFQDLDSLGIRNTDDFKNYLVNNRGDAYLHFDKMPTRKQAPRALPPPEKSHGLIPKEYRPLVWTMLIGFLVAFLADFAAKQAWTQYRSYLTTEWTAPLCRDFKLLFHANIIQGFGYGTIAIMLLTPGCDRMLYNLYWDPRTFPAPNTQFRSIIRQMAIIILGISLCQVLAPSNTGVGIVGLGINVMVCWNFVLLSCFDQYSSVRYWKVFGLEIRLADFYLVTSIVFTALFSAALNKTNVFDRDWKEDGQHEQTLNFYLNCICGICYLAVGLLNFFPIYNTWFMGFYFEETIQRNSVAEFFHRNGACLLIGMSAASLVAPREPGVGLVSFWVHLLLVFWFLAGLCGFHGKIKNQGLWVMWLLNAVLMTILFGWALHSLNDCTANDNTCGWYKNWTEQPWNTWKANIFTNAKWTKCTPLQTPQ